MSEVLEPELIPEDDEPETGFMGKSLPGCSVQEERLVLLYCSGMSAAAAGRAAGYKSAPTTYAVLKREHIREAIDIVKGRIAETIVFGMQEAHAMLMDAYSNAANSTEQRLAVESLMKLHKLGDQGPKKQTNVQINIGRLEQASDEELLKLIGTDAKHLDPSGHG